MDHTRGNRRNARSACHFSRFFRRAGSRLIAGCLTAFVWLLLLPDQSGVSEACSFCGIIADAQTEYVDLGDVRIEDWDAFFQFLDRLPSLKRADIFATPIRAARIEALHERFPGVAFGMTMLIEDHTLRTDATAFSTLHTLRSELHSDQELSLVRYCAGLYALDLGHNRIEDLNFLTELPELRVLILAMNQISDISVLGELEHLEYLEIFNNCISDISCLADLPCLTDLNLAQNQIADIRPVAEIKSLKRLWMRQYHTRLSAGQVMAAAEEIQAALPACQVDAVSASTEGDWRGHPHYDVIQRVFSTGVYEPFADSPPENIPPGF